MDFKTIPEKVVNYVKSTVSAVKVVWNQSDLLFKVCVSIIAAIGVLELMTLSIGLLTSIVFLMFLFTLEGQRYVIREQDTIIKSYENAIQEHNASVSQADDNVGSIDAN